MPQETGQPDLENKIAELQELLDYYRKSEETLRKKYQTLRSYLDAAQGNIVVLDREFNITEVNRPLLRSFNLEDREAVIGLKCYQAMKGLEKPCERCAVPEAYRTGEAVCRRSTDAEKRFIGDRTLEICAIPIRDDNGNVINVLEFARDITDQCRLEEEIRRRRETEEALRRSERDKTSILQTISEPVLYLDTEMRIIWANRAAAEAVAVPAEELIGQYCYRVWLQRKTPCSLCAARTALRTGETARETVRTPDGRTLQISGYPVKDRDGRVLRIVEMVKEISREEQAEKTLQSQLRLERLVASISSRLINSPPDRIDEGIDLALQTLGSFFDVDRSYLFLLRDQGCIMDNTHEWCAAGIEPQKELLQNLPLDKSPWWRDMLHNAEYIHIPQVADMPPEAESEKKILLAQQIRSLVTVPVRYGGSLLGFLGFDSVRCERSWSDANIALLQLVGELIASAVERQRSERERKSLEEQLFQAQKMEAIGTLAGGIAHDFNNLLMLIQGHASLMMLSPGPDADHQDRIEGIQDAVRRGAELTSQLLGFARGGKYEVLPTDLNTIVEKSACMLARTGQGIRIHRRYDPHLPAIEVDRGQIEQVLVNILLNAWQAMPLGGELYLETRTMKLDPDSAEPLGIKAGRFVRTSVSDTGTGMKPEVLKRIFEPFFTTRKSDGGSGLGLASAYGIIRNHGGAIHVESQPGRGSTFHVYIPASSAAPEPLEEKTPASGIVQGTGTILLVDDEVMILDVGATILKLAGYRVLQAESGGEAIDLYRKQGDSIDLVILDLIMPDLHGGAVFDRIREMNPRARILLSSGYSIEGHAAAILERGADGFIQKPYGTTELSAMVHQILDRK
ncbi:MAG TPA: response regulator [Desulfobulbus sp.]|nr:response regulator [Desulfobulbus sp.]